jgi:hypothetical protein
MIFVHIQLDNFYHGLHLAISEMTGQIGVFTSEFSIQVDPLKDVKILFDMLSMGYSFVSAFAFNSWFKGLSVFANGNNLSILKDSTNAVVSAGLKAYIDTQSS